MGIIDWIKNTFDDKMPENPNELYELGCKYNANNNTADCKKANAYFEAAMNLGHIDAALALASNCHHGRGSEKDPARALEIYTKTAAEGSDEAFCRLGLMSENGDGVPVDMEKAAEYYRHAAEHAFPPAQYLLAQLYCRGDGVEENAPMAFSLTRAAAQSDRPHLLTALAHMYRHGTGTERNIDAAIECYEKAADQAYGLAECILGIMYFKGDEVAQDYEKAHDYLMRACDHDCLEALSWLGCLYAHEGFPSHKILCALSYWEKGAKLGDASCIMQLGYLYRDGYPPEIKPDLQKAKKCFQIVSDRKNGNALYALGRIARKEGAADEAEKYFIAAAKTEDNPRPEAWIDLGNLFLFDKKKPMQAVRCFKRSVEEDFGSGAFMLGRIYIGDIDETYPSDAKMAFRWFLKSAALSFRSAHFFLGHQYENGLGTERDLKKAMEHYTICAEGTEDPNNLYAEDAAMALGNIYRDGASDDRGFQCRPDLAKAHAWYEKSAEKDFAPALYVLATICRDGYEGFSPAPEKTVEYLRRAAQNDYAPAQYALGCLYKTGFSDLIAPDDARAFAWCEKGAENGSPSAMYAVGMAYSNGIGVKENDALALKWLQKSAKEGHGAAMCRLGERALFGEDKDTAEAFLWFTRADAAESSLGSALLGFMYDMGLHVPQDLQKARALYEKSAAADNPEARFYLANIYRFGRGVERDYEKARELYESVIKTEYDGYNAPFLYYQMGELCRRGKGGPKDIARAVKMYERSAGYGFQDAMQSLADLYRSGDGIPEDEEKAQEWERRANEELYDNMEKISAMQKRMKALEKQ